MRSTDGDELLRDLLARAARGPRPVRVRAKGGLWHQRAIDLALRALTLGGQSRYLTHYVTTLGHDILVPDGWERVPAIDRYVTLRHELVHVRQFERWGWLGMIVLYGLFPLPVGLAYGRARLEWEAYEETLRATAEVWGLEAAHDPALHREIVARFTGPDYAWMWPFPRAVRGWIAEALARIERDVPSPDG